MNRKQALKIVRAILSDLCDRRGLSHEYDQIDPAIKAEITTTWVRIVMEASK